ncbi:MAG: hypothetical protein WBG86_21035 [Polyangiales bacterium]
MWIGALLIYIFRDQDEMRSRAKRWAWIGVPLVVMTLAPAILGWDR